MGRGTESTCILQAVGQPGLNRINTLRARGAERGRQDRSSIRLRIYPIRETPIMTIESIGFAAAFFVGGTLVEIALAIGLVGLVGLMARAGISK